ncbi:hypothetical protein C3Y92_03945 [Solidesulfovibrio carbinolicus]|uniref:Uncharacterized protein n=1 Tax=Solidesulfovibrio carbinolicus TaxID=296842 RepID=A0A4P6HHG2_9BACT|nr:hypothetical protein C3Y92_03945 [Solidesulfovibrio carbinolicus]
MRPCENHPAVADCQGSLDSILVRLGGHKQPAIPQAFPSSWFRRRGRRVAQQKQQGPGLLRVKRPCGIGPAAEDIQLYAHNDLSGLETVLSKPAIRLAGFSETFS